VPIAAPTREKPPPLEMGLLALAAVLSGIPYALTKIALETIPPVTLVAARVALAAVVLWIVVFALGRKVPTGAGFVGRLCIQGCIGIMIPHTLITIGQQTVDSALAAILNSTSPLFVFLITLFWTRHEPMTIGRGLGVAVGLGGVILIVGTSALQGLGHEVVGQLAIFLATILFAAATIHGRRFAGVAPEVTAAGMLTWAAALQIPLCLLVESPMNSAPSASSIAALVANAVFGTALAFALYFRLLRTLGSMSVASVGYLRPAVGVLIGCVVMAEPFTWTLAIGLAAVVVGVAAITRYAPEPKLSVPAGPTPTV
jgi:drug/metabolite transporter (DMT)-like permease